MSASINKSSVRYQNVIGSVTNYGILAQTGITAGGFTITVNSGVYGNAGGDAQITGTYSGTKNNTNIPNANSDLTNLVNDINALTGPTVVTYNGGTQTFLPSNPTTGTGSLYSSDAATSIVNTGSTLTFNAQNNPNSQFFILSDASITFSNTTFVLQNGALSANIFFVASTAITFATTSPIQGTFIAGSQVTLDSASTVLNGHILAQGTDVTFAANSTVNTSTVCYLKGTKVLTDKGYIAVENLSVGDKVVVGGSILNNSKFEKHNNSKTRSILWTGNFKPSELNQHSFPVCIKAGSIGDNVPFEDLYVSPGHRLIVDGAFVLAKDLVNGSTVFQVDSLDSVEYYHFELESHSAVLANGVLSESYFDTDPTHRLIFDNQKY